jgi:D-alanine-D-alanine ligase-like ATP-grasp enzyme
MATRQCIECGGESAYHGVEYAAVLLDILFLPVFAMLLDRMLYPVFGVPKKGAHSLCTTRLYAALAYVGLGTFLDEPDDKTLLLDRVLWEEAKRRGIVMREFRLLGKPNNTFVAILPGGRRVAFYGIPPMPAEAPAWWVNNKSILKKKLGALGVPVPRGGSVFTLPAAHNMFAAIGTSVITKPAIGSASRHTTMHINTLSELERAFAVAKQVSPFVIVEEELRGCVYRPTLVGGKLIATLRRDQPFVVGNGTSTIEQLIEEENKNPKRGGPYFSPIQLNVAADAELALQGLTKKSIPHKDVRVQLHPKINWAVGGTTTDVSDEVHPDNAALFERVAKILDTSLIGIDFIIDDISRSWHEQPGSGIIECNDMPYFDNHHLPFKGKPRDIAGHVWDLVTP